MNKHKIGIIGVGMVGSSLVRYFKGKENYELLLYDKGQGLGSMDDINKAEFVYVCVPTPYTEEKGCDISIVDSVIGELTGEKIVIIRSTVIPGTTEKMQEKYPQHKVLFSPEFLTELTADQDMSYPDRQIVGYTDKSFVVAKEILLQMPLAPFERIVPATEAEMIKYSGNCWFATKVTFANQIYDLCQRIGIDYKTVLEGLAADKRIGRTHLKIHHKGYRGFGGKCIPKDSKALIKFAKDNGIEVSILQTVDKYNDALLRGQDLDPLDTDTGHKREDNEKGYVISKEIKVKKRL